MMLRGGGTPQLASDSSGSKMRTRPHVSPRANWLGSLGCAAIVIGYIASELQQKNENKRVENNLHEDGGTKVDTL